MTRDELLLTALAAGEASPPALARVTGLSERTCRNGLYHLAAEGYAWRPARSLWRLTEAGRTISSALSLPPPADWTTVEYVPYPATEGETPAAAETAALAQPRERTASKLVSLGWRLAWLAAIAVAVLGRRLPTPTPQGPPPVTLAAEFPYDDWRSYRPPRQ
jgi:hypothetical protein